ncbi:hypothetical protein ACE3MS_15710 [Paenibacillus dendritiformis]|uniref:hypothetical protein n=1 Tax=Paenibacillus dendritiformis TaxID=130049 RepID=UPI0036533F26
MSFRKTVLVYPANNDVAQDVIQSLHTSIHVQLLVLKSDSVLNDQQYVKIIDSQEEPRDLEIEAWNLLIEQYGINYIYLTNGQEQHQLLPYRGRISCELINSFKSISLYRSNHLSSNDINYTIDCFTDEDGQLLFARGFKEITSSEGRVLAPVSVCFNSIAESLKDSYKLRGYWHFQILDCGMEGKKVTSISSLPSKGIGLWRGRGVNIPLLSIYHAMGNPLGLIEKDLKVKGVTTNKTYYYVDIQYERVYIDLDDTIVIQGQLNKVAISFIIQCINRNISVHLISKHRGDICQYLKQYRIEQLFDSIIWLNSEERKSDYIVPEGSIFIDDAYRERKEVHSVLEIPTFDVASIPLLIN